MLFVMGSGRALLRSIFWLSAACVAVVLTARGTDLSFLALGAVALAVFGSSEASLGEAWMPTGGRR